jgi:hypothetical protein
MPTTTNVANNLVAGDWHATDLAGTRGLLKTTNVGGVHQLHVIDDALTPQAGGSQKLAFTATSAATNAIAGTIVRVVSMQNCHLAFGASPTAVADGTCVYLPAGVVQFFAVTSGSKIAAIQDSAGGNLFITVMS